MENKPNRLASGLVTDTSYIDQPPNTTSFVLNGVNETIEGDTNFLANEEANEVCYNLTAGYRPLGKVYIDNGETLIFSVSPTGVSEIGIANRECEYRVVVNGDLGFSIENQIHGTYRLRRGCERTVYFVTPKILYINLNKLEDFKDGAGDWDLDKFSLYKTYSSIPNFDNIEVTEGGNLSPGSYNIAVQYLDTDFNPTEWITTSDVIRIKNDSENKDYLSVRGSTNNVNSYQNFGATNKSIKVTLSNMDTDYVFYRLAIIEATSGQGGITRVGFTEQIPIELPVYTYTGKVFTEGTEEEILQFTDILEEAKHIEQIENKLILSNTKGKQINFCRLQSYASRIQADAVLTNVTLNKFAKNNPKNATADFEKTGYMPGEIYSFAVVWVFEKGFLSPAYHIPGKNATTTGIPFVNGAIPMSVDNTLQNSVYTDNSCSAEDYWGVDSEGAVLKDQSIRHHRFPTRAEMNIPLVTNQVNPNSSLDFYKLIVDITGTIDAGYTNTLTTYSVDYSIDGVQYTVERTFVTADFIAAKRVILSSGSFIIVDNVYENGVLISNPNPSGLSYVASVETDASNEQGEVYTTDIVGIKFSNIVPPSLNDTNGNKVVGYYIVRNERGSENRTILDSGVLAPLLEEDYFIGHGHIMPNLPNTNRIRTDSYALIHPEFSFSGTEYKNADTIVKEGEFTKVGSSVISRLKISDAMAGSSFDPEIHKKREADSDGFDLNIMVRDTEVEFTSQASEVLATGNEIDEIFYLDALNSKTIEGSDNVEKEVFNVSADNKVGIVKLNKVLPAADVLGSLPYVILKRELEDPYSNFRIASYYKETVNPQMFTFDGLGNVTSGDETDVYNGDTVVTPIRYTSSSFFNIDLTSRRTKSGVFNFILGVVAIAVGVILSIPSGGASLTITALGVSAIGLGISQVATGLRKGQIGKVWGELYEQGLRSTVNDTDTINNLSYGYNNTDDEVQWFSDTVTNLWFESTVNASIRQGTTVNVPDFLDAPANKSLVLETGFVESPQNEVDSHILSKLTNLDPEQNDGRLYQGFANAELYEINPDYLRKNTQKVFTHLGIEYDCCSDCTETFPNRTHYSETSFQEELTDNYRVFLPNNYRDLEGEHGEITNVYRFYNNLFLHTEEALWKLPQNFQERVTNEIVSFIGTGDFFSIPPQKIVEGEMSSAGTRHKEGCLKTKHGILFPSEDEGKWYLFNGKELRPLSDEGNSKWFRNNMHMVADKQYLESAGREFEFSDNPSNILGTGFLSTYDTNKERLIVTKKDFSLTDSLLATSDYRLCENNGTYTRFANYTLNITTRENNGFSFEGIEDCRMKFSKRVVTLGVEETIYEYYDGVPILLEEIIGHDRSWTMSYSLKKNSWVGWHSYTPDFYFYAPERFYAWQNGTENIWKFNKKGQYQTYFGTYYPYIVEYVDVNNPLVTKLWDYLTIQTTAETYSEAHEEYLEERYLTFNKIVVYNSRQMSGELELLVKDVNADAQGYMGQQIVNNEGSIILDRNEKDWTLNDLRDVRTNHTVPMFNKNIEALTPEYYIDKTVNESAIDFQKSWTQLESFRDKYLVIRLILDKFDDTRLIINYSIENESQSSR